MSLHLRQAEFYAYQVYHDSHRNKKHHLFSWPESPAPGQSWLVRPLLCWVYLVVNQGERWSGPFIIYIHYSISPKLCTERYLCWTQVSSLKQDSSSGSHCQIWSQCGDSEKMVLPEHSTLLSRISLGRLHVD